ncbi:protein Wiz isoform X2 [Trichomycterus rosablanca]|uniref:protein Wiz isoform X2 n=1 Tax=Trichomycterus rosablanca TaxID=2290929 RepID=UPI002F35F069
MEPEAGLSPTMDPHDPTSFRALSESPTLLSNSLMGELSHDGCLESNDGDANPQKIIFYGSNQKKRQSSAFPSSLTWDSDSEKETFDEEELQHFSNPHGLAAQSPGSPSCVQEQDGPDSGDYYTLEKPKNILLDNDLTSPLEEEEQAGDNTEEEPGMAQSETQKLEEIEDGSVLDQDGLPHSDTKPKEGYQKKKIKEQGLLGVQRKKAMKSGSEQDVYTFPGDSDPESPPPGPWAHCTFVQRRRKKRALLRPFSGLSPWQRTPVAGRRTRVTPSRVKEFNKMVSDVGGVFEFKDDEEERVQDKGEEFRPEIFTCVECSVYFNKQAHLREHMREHGQVDGDKGEHGEEGTARRRSKNFECVECGQNFADRLLLLKHHKLHEESRQKILEDMGKLNNFEKMPEMEKTDCRSSKQPAAKESFSNCGQFVGLNCNYISDEAQEISDHTKTHTSRARPGGHRASPRFQLKSFKKGTSENVTSSTVVSEKYPTRASVQMVDNKPEVDHSQPKVSEPQGESKVDPLLGSSQSNTVSASPARPTELPDLAGSQTEDAPLATTSLQQESSSTETGLAEESVPKPHSPEPSNSTAKTTPQRRYVAFKSTGKRRSKRFARGAMGRTRTSSKLDSQPADTSDVKSEMQDTEETEEQSQNEAIQEPSHEPESEGDLAVTTETGVVIAGVESFAVDSEPNSSPPPKLSDESTEEKNKEIQPENDKDECSTNYTTDMKYDHDDDDDDDDDGDDDDGEEDEEDDEDVLNHLLNVLNEEDEEDEDGIAFKTLEKRCPYCQDCFDNGIGLANHIRGHLNRVGVSYKVRHFISPEEVNAIEKKFSYQKKKKKATFSVMHCEFCSAGFDTRAGLSSHARAHLRDFGITNWEVTASPITVLRELFSKRPDLALSIPTACNAHAEEQESGEDEEECLSAKNEDSGTTEPVQQEPESPVQPWKEEQCDSEAEAPTDHLYQITQEHATDDRLPSSPLSSPNTPSPRVAAEFEDEPQDVKPPLPLSVLDSVIKAPRSPSSLSPSGSQPPSPYGRSQSPSRSRSPSPVLRKAPISSLLPVSSLLRSHEHKNMARGHNTALSATHSRPLWATQETDAPLNLTMDADANEDIICKLCGAWFETRKGLSSHARAHLRHFGVEYSESRGSPIDLLNTLILTDDFKHRATSFVSDSPEDRRIHGYSVASPSLPTSSHVSSASKKPFSSSSLLFKNTQYRSSTVTKNTSSSSSASFHSMHSPPAKKLKQSSQQVFRMSGVDMMSIPPAEPLKDVSCEFCGELFENRKGLSSHARSHLRQLGITVWSVNGSPIDTLRELIMRRGLPCAIPPKPLKLPSSSPSLGSSRTSLPFSSMSGSINRMPFNQHQSAVHKMPVSPPATSTSSTVLMVKPKPEPEQVEITLTEDGMGGCDGYSSESLHPSWMSTDNVRPVSLVMAPEREPSRDIRCNFCGEFFENRKGLSSHARSHLRQMGITEWSVNGSPIDTLWEIMRNQGIMPASSVLGVKEEPQQDDGSSWNGQGYQSQKVSPKASLNLLHSGSRLHKHGLGPMGPSNTSSSAKLFGMAQFGKRMLGNKRHLEENLPVPSQSKTFSPPPQDFSYKGKMSTDKYGVGRMEASCELCGFVFENRKALASHARAHLRQFGVTEWSVNGSPIETLSAWMRSRPETVAELHRSYLSGGHSFQKKKRSAAQWTSPTLTQAKSVERENTSSLYGAPLQASEDKNGNGTPVHHGITTQDTEHSFSSANSAPPRVQVARSELNVRVPRGIERRPLKHPLHADGGERESCPPKPSRTSTVPALVPKPPSTPLVKLNGKIYSLKCRFCDVEFQGPLSVQEDWIRHLQQHILKLDYKKPAPAAAPTLAKPDTAAPEIQASATTSTLTITTAAPTPVSAKNPTPKLTPHPSVCTSALSPIPTLTSTAHPAAAAEQEVLAPAT